MNVLAEIKGTRANKNKKKNRRKDQTKDLSSKNANENNKVRLCHLIKHLLSIYYTTYFIRLVSSFALFIFTIPVFKKVLFLIQYAFILGVESSSFCISQCQF